MSLILEALKKSEQQRRLGEAPTLGSPVLITRKRRSLLPLFGVLILAALAVGWWLMRSPEPEAVAPKADAVDGAPAPAQPAGHPAKPAAAPQAPGGRPAPNANPATANRTAAPAPAATKPPIASAPPTAAAPKNPPVAKPPAGSAKPPVASTPPAPPAAAPTRPAVEGKPASPNATVAPPPPTTTARPAPAQPALPSIWDLPYSTRKDLPELPLTMHVYASAPADRFVVIKGERHAEGDDLGDGVTLKEIRADGMVLEFKGQRFVYPRDGR
jgi:general secretion pathway protein B